MNANALVLIPTGNTLWVDAVNGNDSTGQRGQLGAPFLTLTAAKNAATSGDMIFVLPGTYNERNLLKNGVNWYFSPGAVVAYNGTSAGGIFDDSATGANAAIGCVIGGYGTFTSVTSGTITSSVVNLTNSASNVAITCDYMGADNTTTSGATPNVLLAQAGKLTVHARKLEFLGSTLAGSAIVYMDGWCEVTADEINSLDAGGITGGTETISAQGVSSPTGELLVKAHRIFNARATAGNGCVATLGNSTQTVRIEADEIVASGFQSITILGTRTTLYVTAERIVGAIGNQAGGSAWLSRSYVKCKRLSGNQNQNTPLITMDASVSKFGYFEIGEIIDTYLSDMPAVKFTGYTNTMYLVGTRIARTTSGDAIQTTSNVVLIGVTISGVTSGSGSAYDLNQSGISPLTVLACKYNPANTNGTITSGDPRAPNGVMAKTSNYTVSATDGNTFFTNTGATGEVDFTLPTAAAGLTYSFYVDAAQTVKLICPGSATIQLGGSVTSAGGNARNSTTGSTLTLVCVTSGSSGKWVAQSSTGTWVLN